MGNYLLLIRCKLAGRSFNFLIMYQTVSYLIPSNTDFKPDIVYLQGNWKNNPDNMELQNDTGRIVLAYYAKSVNIIAGGKGGGIVLMMKTQHQQRRYRTNP
jgi:Thioredoxin like C-terminal domain